MRIQYARLPALVGSSFTTLAGLAGLYSSYRVESLKTIGFVKKTSKYGQTLKLNRLHSPHYSKIRDTSANLA